MCSSTSGSGEQRSIWTCSQIDFLYSEFDPLFTPGSSKENVLVMVETVAGRSEVHCWGIACEDRAVIEKSRDGCWAVMD